ncbi:hypothetical protein [Virgibacillus halodenitrificans]|uniref:Spo0E family sporulation regulatory protein-aspartic acid phosphatase n=1 Tax=Virgibacillus halodenitrificans TaxID=1482 RepID=A0ABR7VW60_VIRHA|nr:hypothetical protein [Virgibacillus halodenitrificans]MBD1224797.1 hypothetical protein [Virgibacillus halodenitrificans]
MKNVINNYKNLLEIYEFASELYLKTNSIKLLKYAINELEQFERLFVEYYSLNELQELQMELGSQMIAIV